MQRTRIYLDEIETPLGRIGVAGDDRAVLRVLLPGPQGLAWLKQELLRVCGPVEFKRGGEIPGRFSEELAGYFQGTLFTFRTPVRVQGTPFQERVWEILSRIPYGETRTYGWVARCAGTPGGARAVGQANARNPLPLVVPCHRVVAANGRLGGFSSGRDQKRFLLALEQRTHAPARTDASQET